MSENDTGHYIILVSVHGLVRGTNLELGRDADNGGQIQYVVELARALARHPDVWRVDLLTRQVIDHKVSSDYAEILEAISDHAFIVRLPCGPRRYLRKEVLWPHLDSFNDHALQHIRRIGRLPTVIHSHYADAGYTGSRLSALLGVPLVHTGHSLGRVKLERMLEHGAKRETIESQYNISQRIEAEEQALDSARLVIASTQQEVEEQYSQYEHYQPKRMEVIPPGVDLERFHPPKRQDPKPGIGYELARFLAQPRRPMILALSRPDERKNIETLLRAFGTHPRLRDMANLVVVAGNRDDVAAMDRGARSVLTNLMLMIDRYDLYGTVAIPKHHRPEDVPALYRLAARSKGIFVNPALTEPFGLTLIEAAACGVPILATEDGGPRDIIKYCSNGMLMDPLDASAMGNKLEEMLGDTGRWNHWSRNGLRGVKKHYSWDSHVKKYLAAVKRMQGGSRKKMVEARSRLPMVDRLFICALDNTLLGDRRAVLAFAERMKNAGQNIGFGIATGRSLDNTLKVIKENRLPMPDLMITSVGAEIHYGHKMVEDVAWTRHIDHRWEPEALRKVLDKLPGLKLQAKADQHRFKISYFFDEKKAPSYREIVRRLRQRDLHANVIQSRGMFLDVVPVRVSKGLAMRFLSVRWGIVPENILVAGSCGNDDELLRGNTLGVVVANYGKELEKLKGRSRIYFTEGEHAWGVLEGIDYYNFFGDIYLPQEESALA